MTAVLFLEGIYHMRSWEDTLKCNNLNYIVCHIPGGSASEEVDGREYRVGQSDAHCEVGVI